MRANTEEEGERERRACGALVRVGGARRARAAVRPGVPRAADAVGGLESSG